MHDMHFSLFNNNNKTPVDSDLFKNNGTARSYILIKLKKENQALACGGVFVSIVNNCIYF